MHNAHQTGPVKKFFIDLLMGCIFLALLAFALWLLWIYFLRAEFDTGLRDLAGKSELELIAEGSKEGWADHFHNIDQAVLAGAEKASLCLKCHGNYPHSKAPDIRAFLNAHAYFTACEACHIRPQPGDQIIYKWLSNDTGLELLKLNGKPGNYGAMIVPIMVKNGVSKRLDESADKEFVEKYLKLRATFNADQQAEAKVRIHEHISEKPIFCDECHTAEGGLLDFHALLYPDVVANRLETGEVAAMIGKYAKFYLPTMFDPNATFRERNKPETVEDKVE